MDNENSRPKRMPLIMCVTCHKFTIRSHTKCPTCGADLSLQIEATTAEKQKKQNQMEKEYNRNGGLTLVPLPGFIDLAEQIKELIEKMTGPKRHLTGVDIAIPEFGERASGEPYVRLPKKHIVDHDCVIITSGPGTYKMLVQLQLALAYLVGRRAGRIVAVTNYLPLTRSDKDEGEYELALLSMIINVIESAASGKLDRIIAVDLHAAQEVTVGSKPGFITEVSLVRPILQKVISDIKAIDRDAKICILFPDEGSQKRFEAAVEKTLKQFNMEAAFICGQKRRASSHASATVGISGDLISIKDSYVIGLDDEIATGGTNDNIARIIKNTYGAKAYYAAAVHGVLCGKAPVILTNPECGIDYIYVTDTIPVKTRPELEPLVQSGRLIVVPWAEELAEIIYRHHWGEDIRSMR